MALTRNAIRNGLAVTILMIGTGLLLTACGKDAQTVPTTQASSPPSVPVKVRVAESRGLQRTVRVVGNLAGLETATLSNRVTGTVEKVYVDVGDRVKPGATLLQIDPTRFQFWFAEAEAAQQETLAMLGIKDVPDNSFDVNQTAPVKKAQAELDNAKSKLDRQKPLFEQGTIKYFEFFDTESAYKVAQSGLETSRDSARSLVNRARRERAEIDVKKKDLEETVIQAPNGLTPDGIRVESYSITSRKASVGEYLREGTALFSLVADDKLKLQARVPERFLGKVTIGEKVTFRIEAYPAETFEGTVHRIEPTVDQTNRTFLIEALVENAAKYQGRLKPGSFVQGEILTGIDPNCIMVPLEAIASFVGVNKIYVVPPAFGSAGGSTGMNAQVHAIEVTTGQQDGSWIEIKLAPGEKHQLNPGDRVAIDGLTKLVDGAHVEINE
ncbi:MAG: efflux RND transporter periplasmic adaptor subunit [Phycisphaerales bacterium]|nr:efflux RND transporter periplasmic adaptor subunit [Phycisphaerales bacterium]